ncbi:MAG: polysaccharide pyruvyl transferase family protein [bacterium]
MKRICVIGNFSGRNAGDAAILGCLLEDVSRLYPDVEYDIPTINPGFVRRHYSEHRIRPVPMLPWNLSAKIFGLPVFRSVLRSDLVLVTDAILFDLHLFNPLFNYLSTMALVLPMARSRGIPVVLYNVSLGPITSRAGRVCMNRVLRSSSRIVVRDRESTEMLQRLGLEHGPIDLGADCALCTRPSDAARIDEISKAAGISWAGRGTVSFNVNSYLDVFVRQGGKRFARRHFAELMAATVDRTINELNVNALFVMTQPMDTGINDEVLALVRRRDAVRLVTNRECTYRDIAGLFSRVSLHVGMRTHSLILASSVGTPIIGIIATPKNRGFMRSIGQDARMVEFQDLTADRLFNLISESWQNRQAISAHVASEVLKAAELARKTATFLAPYLGDR